ncbi:MAG TPA: hypothetical protein VLT57_16270 [Bryobacteraceae bacterium]|nr:hypothetical protein [Bryobacteraceae bacterium]
MLLPTFLKAAETVQGSNIAVDAVLFGRLIAASGDALCLCVSQTRTSDMTDVLSEKELAGIEARANAATQGPWEVWDGCSWRRIGGGNPRDRRPIIEPCVSRSDGHPDLTGPNLEDDLAFAVHARTDIPRLLAHIRATSSRPSGAAAMREAAANLLAALKSAVKIADEAADEWDNAPDGMRAGKLLVALAGHRKGYRADIDAIHEAISAASALPIAPQEVSEDKP